MNEFHAGLLNGLLAPVQSNKEKRHPGKQCYWDSNGQISTLCPLCPAPEVCCERSVRGAESDHRIREVFWSLKVFSKQNHSVI